MTKSRKKTDKSKQLVELRIGGVPKELRKKLLYHKNHRMENDPTMPEACIAVLQKGIEAIEKEEQVQVV